MNILGGFFKAFDRRELISTVLQGRAALSANVIPAQGPFALTEEELVTFEGYKEDRATEEREARQMWDAGGGAALGPIILDIPDIWEGLYSGGSAVLKARLEGVLGNPVEIKIEPYSTIANKLLNEHSYGNGKLATYAGWTSDIQSLDPSATLFLAYNSANPLNRDVFGVKVPKVDEITLANMAEFDVEKRKENSKEATREILRNWGMGNAYTANGIVTVLSWNYFKYREAASFVTQHQAATGTWLDTNDPTYEGRA
jgi:ABC-type transport system substrate-binding protein